MFFTAKYIISSKNIPFSGYSLCLMIDLLLAKKSMKRILLTWMTSLAVLGATAQCLPFDMSYNATGYKQFDLATFTDGRAFAMQTDNKVIVLGPVGLGSGSYDWKVTRLNTDGSVDQTFGINGYVQISFGATCDEP